MWPKCINIKCINKHGVPSIHPSIYIIEYMYTIIATTIIILCHYYYHVDRMDAWAKCSLAKDGKDISLLTLHDCLCTKCAYMTLCDQTFCSFPLYILAYCYIL